VGSKFLVAVTGFLLTGFVVQHMIGNLKMFGGRDAMNSYAAFLKGLGPLLWVARIGLLLVFLAHILLAMKLKARSLAARPIAYQYQNTIQATAASRSMVMTGLVILVFTIYHIAHFTLGLTQNYEKPGDFLTKVDPTPADPLRHDVYSMVIAGFTNPGVAITYIVAQVVLLVHLSHGVASVFQTLGLNTPRTQRLFKTLGWVVALTVFAGNLAIVVAVWTGVVK
jgi:succinate dehydrogenase / fumarate reductase cytochrome b subunit